VSGVGIEPAEVTLIDGLDVVAHRAVVAAVVPALRQLIRYGEHLGDLGAGVAMIREPERLVVQVLVEIALPLQELDRLVLPPDRPLMRDKHHVGLVAEERDRLVEMVCPRLGVAHLRTTRRVQVVHGVRDVLRHAQRP
jgi:hypothetical protein